MITKANIIPATFDATAGAQAIQRGYVAYAKGNRVSGDNGPLKIYASSDTYVDIQSSSSNYGSSTTLNVLGYNNYFKRIFLGFDLSSAPTEGLVKAELFIYLLSNDVVDRPQQHRVKRITSSWSATTATWDSQPTFYGSTGLDDGAYANLAHVGGNAATVEVWRFATITALVNEWLEGTYTNYGLCIDHTYGQSVDGGTWASMAYCSSEYNDSSLRPYLLLTY